MYIIVKYYEVTTCNKCINITYFSFFYLENTGKIFW